MKSFMWRLTIVFFYICFLIMVIIFPIYRILAGTIYWLFVGKDLFEKPSDGFPVKFFEAWADKMKPKEN